MSSAFDWRAKAACRDKDPELFFPVGNTGAAYQQIEEAKAVCRTCMRLRRKLYATCRIRGGITGSRGGFYIKKRSFFCSFDEFARSR